mgnify:FL=1
MEQLLLQDLLHISDDEMNQVKIKFNQFNGSTNPMDEYQLDPEVVNSRWLFWRNKRRYFYVGQIAICLLKLSEDLWLLTTIKRVVEEFNVQQGVNYRGEELPEYRALFGRVIIRFHKTFMTQGRYYREIMNDLVVNQILPDKYDGDNFPGYDNVRLSYWQLSAIINKAKQDWVAALRSQKAVYLITDKNTGKLYVGSATSDNGMLLQRWSAYVKNGHGGNKELMALVEKLGFEYVKSYFQYSILENYNQKVEDKVILERESWWKETLQSRKWGYNDN